MALVVRLSLSGKRGQPIYRIVVSEKRSKRDGKYNEKLGYYNPNVQPFELKINRDRLDYWTKQGATISTGLKKLLDIKS